MLWPPGGDTGYGALGEAPNGSCTQATTPRHESGDHLKCLIRYVLRTWLSIMVWTVQWQEWHLLLNLGSFITFPPQSLQDRGLAWRLSQGHGAGGVPGARFLLFDWGDSWGGTHSQFSAAGVGASVLVGAGPQWHSPAPLRHVLGPGPGPGTR